MADDYQVGDEITTYRPTPRPIDVEGGELLPPIPPLSDKRQEREYAQAREKIRIKIWGR
jgi:hypothetical protein